jgi:hypothetical protein
MSDCSYLITGLAHCICAGTSVRHRTRPKTVYLPAPTCRDRTLPAWHRSVLVTSCADSLNLSGSRSALAPNLSWHRRCDRTLTALAPMSSLLSPWLHELFRLLLCRGTIRARTGSARTATERAGPARNAPAPGEGWRPARAHPTQVPARIPVYSESDFLKCPGGGRLNRHYRRDTTG